MDLLAQYVSNSAPVLLDGLRIATAIARYLMFPMIW
jgi:hypothetical protein